MTTKADIKLVSGKRHVPGKGWQSTDTIDAGTARVLLDASGTDGVSKVNRALPKALAIDILRKGIASLGDDQPIDILTARNILREVGRPDVAKRVG